MTTDVRSPGGWLNLLNTRIGRWLVVGTLAAGGGAAVFYGDFQGQGAAQFVEVELDAVAAADQEIISVLNPLPEDMTGAVLFDYDTYALFESAPSPASTLDIGVSDADGQAATNDDIFDGLVPLANKVFPARGSGAAAFPARVIVAPRNYTGSASYITARWKTGSGQTVGGVPAGFARIKVVPCVVGEVACD